MQVRDRYSRPVKAIHNFAFLNSSECRIIIIYFRIQPIE